MILAGMPQIVNRSAAPVRILEIESWEPAGLTLRKAQYITVAGAGRKGPKVGGAGQEKGVSRLEDAGYEGWEHAQDLTGALIDPCCDRAYLLGLTFDVTAGRQAGWAHGIVITYRTADGRRFRTHVPVAMSFCTGDRDVSTCEEAEKSDWAQYQAGTRALSAPPEDFKEPATWPGNS